jgi:two-component system sensor histidine kinase UhpB
LVKRAGETDRALEAANQINELARRIHHSTRQLLRQLRPPVLDELSLQEALHHLVNEFAFAERGIACHFDYRLSSPCQRNAGFTLYRLLQELLNNVCKHACASDVRIALSEQNGRLRLEVHDNGLGIAAEKMPGFGIQGMRERVHALGVS